MIDKKVVPQNEGLKKIVSKAAGTEAGRDLLAHLARRCGQFQTSISRMADGEIASLSTEAKEAQRLIWLELRAMMPVSMRHSIEEMAETPVPVKPQEERKK